MPPNLTPLDFVWRHIGDIVTAPGGLGGECVDLANLWLLEAFGAPHVWADAVKWQFAQIRAMVWEPNLPRNMPIPGSLVVWGPQADWHIGPNGHIALSLAASATYLVTLDQNWPEGSPCRLHIHDYRGVIGWHRPK
jgi:hypothetical protein